MKKVSCFFCSMSVICCLHAQVNLHGTIYKDAVKKLPADSALVYVNGGEQSYADKEGKYAVRMYLTDTLFIVYLSNTYRYFLPEYWFASGASDIYLNDSSGVNLMYHQLKPVSVKSSNYNVDSIDRRKEYEQVFDYRSQKVSMGNNKWHDSVATIGGKVALDTRNKKLSLLNVTSLAHAIKSKKKKQTLRLQKRLLETEHADYVEHTFTPALVEKYSGMHNDDSLRLFIRNYAPPYETFIQMNELDVGMYIIKNIRLFRTASVSETP